MKTNQIYFLTISSPCYLHVNVPPAGKGLHTLCIIFVIFSGIVLLWGKLLLCHLLVLCPCSVDNLNITL